MLLDVTFPRGYPLALATVGPRGTGASLAPCVPELGVGPASPQALRILAGIRVSGKEVPPRLGWTNESDAAVMKCFCDA